MIYKYRIEFYDEEFNIWVWLDDVISLNHARAYIRNCRLESPGLHRYRILEVVEIYD